MENSLLVIFDEIWPNTLYIQGHWPDFGTTLKIRRKSKFDQNQLKISTQYQDVYMYQIKLLKWRILS